MEENIKLKVTLEDLTSGTLNKIGVQGNSVFGRLGKRVDAFASNARKKLANLRIGINDKHVHSAMVSVEGLNIKLRQLTARRDLQIDTRKIKQLNREIHHTEMQLSKLQKLGMKDGGHGGGHGGGMGMWEMMLMGGAIYGGQKIIGDSISVARERGKSRARLQNALGSDMLGEVEMEKIKEFAAKTPFGVTELSDAFAKLTNHGLKPTKAQMTQLGDIASYNAKGIDQLAEAVLDAKVGEFERLREFGIKTKVEGDKVTFTFKEQQTTVKNTSKAIQNYILSLGNAQGVMGSMAKMNKELDGELSNMGDSWDNLVEKLGNTGLVRGSITFLTTVLDGLGQSVDALGRKEIPLFERLASFTGVQANMLMQAKSKILSNFDTTKIVAKYAEKIPEQIQKKVAEGMTQKEATEAVRADYQKELERWTKKADTIEKKTIETSTKFYKEGATDTALIEKQMVSNKIVKSELEAFKSIYNDFDKIAGINKKGSGTGGLGDGVDKVIGDARAAKNLTINIDKLIESVTVKSETIQGGAQNVAEELRKALLTAVNDANYAIGR